MELTLREAISKMTRCGDCNKCCIEYDQADGPWVLPHDHLPASMVTTNFEGKRSLRILANGDCMNLARTTRRGCVIHEVAPLVCQTYPFMRAREDGQVHTVLLPSCARFEEIVHRFIDTDDKEAQECLAVILEQLPEVMDRQGLCYENRDWSVLVKLRARTT